MQSYLQELQPNPDRNPTREYLKDLQAQASKDTMRAALNKLTDIGAQLLIWPAADPIYSPRFKKNVPDPARCETTPWARLTPTQTTDLAEQLRAAYKPASANLHINALKGVLKAAKKLKLIDAERFDDLTDIKRVKGNRDSGQDYLRPHQVEALLNACNDGTLAGRRDAALFAVMIYAGQRREAVATLQMSDYNPSDASLRCHVKGNDDIVTWAEAPCRIHLHEWIRVRPPVPGPMFVPVQQNDRPVMKPMNPASINNILAQRCAIAGLKHYSPHDLRRTFATQMLQNKVPIDQVAALMNHADINTTKRYDRSGETSLREALKTLDYNTMPALPIPEGQRHRARAPKALPEWQPLMDNTALPEPPPNAVQSAIHNSQFAIADEGGNHGP